MTDPKPSFHKTYRRADGEEIADFGWVTDLDHFDCIERPMELVEETWWRTHVHTFWLMPTTLYTCEIEDEGEPCEEDAVAWQRHDDEWLQVCEKHQATGADR